MGSRQHYYHFLLGVLLPLADYLARTGEATLPMMVRSCGPLDAILYELQLPRLMISDTESHQNLGDSLSPEVARKVGIAGFDIGLNIKAYDGEPIIAGARSGGGAPRRGNRHAPRTTDADVAGDATHPDHRPRPARSVLRQLGTLHAPDARRRRPATARCRPRRDGSGG